MTLPPQPPQNPAGGWPPPTPPAGAQPPPAPAAGWPQQPAHGAGWPQQPAPGGGWPQQPVAGGGWPQQPGPQQAYPPPGGGGWPQPGGTGHHPPRPVPPAPVTKRIPEDQPFTVRANVAKRAMVFGALLLFVVLVMACPMSLATSGTDGAVGLLVFLAGFAVLTGLLLGLQLWLMVSGGPVLAIGPAGLWIKTRPTRGQAIWLPWEAIERIHPRRWSLEKMLCVKPRDPRAGGDLGAFTALDSGMQQLFFGTGFTATLNFADRPEAEIMQAVAHYSAGRCRIG